MQWMAAGWIQPGSHALRQTPQSAKIFIATHLTKNRTYCG